MTPMECHQKALSAPKFPDGPRCPIENDSNWPIFSHLAALVAVSIVTIAIQAARMINFIGPGGATEPGCDSRGISSFKFGSSVLMSACIAAHIFTSQVQPGSSNCLKIKTAGSDPMNCSQLFLKHCFSCNPDGIHDCVSFCLKFSVITSSNW